MVIDARVVSVVQVPLVQVIAKTAEIVQLQVDDKVVDVPVVLVVPVSQVQVVKKTVEDPQLQIVKKTVEIPELQFTDKVDIPVVTQRQIRMNPDVQKTIEIPQLQHTDDVVDVPVQLVAQVPRVKVAEEAVETPQLQIVKRTVEIPEIRMVRGTQTSESRGTARTGQLAQETKVYRDEACCMQQRMQQQMQQQAQQQKQQQEQRQKQQYAEQQHQKPAAPDKAMMNVQRGDSRTFQIFVKTDDLKTMTMDVTPNDKIQDVVRRGMGCSKHDVYVTCEGRMLNENAELKSSEVRDGSTVQVVSRLRGGGRHKEKRNRAEKKRGRSENGQEGQQVETVVGGCPEMTQSQKDVVIQLLERNEGYRKIIKMISETADEEHGMQCFRVLLQQESGFNEETMKVMEWGVRWAVEARRHGRDEEQEQRRQQEQEQRRQEQEEQRQQAEQGQNTERGQSKQGKQVRFRDEEQLEETRAETAGEPEVMGRTTEVRTGRGSAGLVRGRDERYWANETSKGEHEGKGGGFGHNGKQEETREREEERVRVAPNMGAGGSHPQATSDPGEGEMAEGKQQRNEEKEEILKLLRGWQEKETSPIMRWAWADESTEEESNLEEVREESGEEEKKETRGMRWADCEDDE